MGTFEWSALFETGLADVDQQHRQLVELVNRLGQDANGASTGHLDAALTALAEYTVYHFQCEEAVMVSAGVAAAHSDRHRATHQRFIAQVGNWLNRRRQGEAVSLHQLLEFLSNWLVFHILGDDQALGRQVLAIRAGTSPQAAHDGDHSSDDPRTEILLGALRRLYSGLVDRNDELLMAKNELSELNATLERRVIERTAELRQANQRLQEEQERVIAAEKMASLGRLVAGFAHEVNTPIGVAVGVLSQSQMQVSELRRLLGEPEVAEEDFERCIDLLDQATELGYASVQRAAELVKSFKRTTADQASESVRDYNLAELIDDVLRSLRNAFKSTSVNIEVDCPADLNLHGPAGMLVQILNNLLLNSRTHAFADGTRAGRIRISARAVGAELHLRFADDGAGMDTETLAHAFEPFFTTRRGTGGSGLGLYIVYNLVTQGLKGRVTCDSAADHGTQLLIRFPLHSTGSPLSTEARSS